MATTIIYTRFIKIWALCRETGFGITLLEKDDSEQLFGPFHLYLLIYKERSWTQNITTFLEKIKNSIQLGTIIICTMHRYN